MVRQLLKDLSLSRTGEMQGICGGFWNHGTELSYLMTCEIQKSNMKKMWDKYQGLDPALWYSSWAWLSVIENHLLTVYALEMWEAKQEKLLWLCILAQKVMAFYSGIAASAFTLFCYVRNLVLGFNLHCQHRAMPPQQNVRKGSVKKTIPTIQINSAHTAHYLSKPLALYWFSSQPFSETIIRFFYLSVHLWHHWVSQTYMFSER